MMLRPLAGFCFKFLALAFGRHLLYSEPIGG